VEGAEQTPSSAPATPPQGAVPVATRYGFVPRRGFANRNIVLPQDAVSEQRFQTNLACLQEPTIEPLEWPDIGQTHLVIRSLRFAA